MSPAHLARAALGLALGLAFTEAAFRHRDGAAFPLVNVYEPDPVRGVRLTPGSATVVARPGERPTHVRVNRDGYRGPDWPSPAPTDVVVAGDSLTFGLGVEEDEAFAARLHAALPGAPAVLDASVPTYGPPEYLATVAQILPRRRPGTVVLAINLVNDLAEIDAPNRGRHTALDGWAARLDRLDGEAPRASSPFVMWAIQRSHAAFALWRWARTPDARPVDPGAEPGLDGLLRLAGRMAAASRAVDAHRREEAQRASALVDARMELRAAQGAVLAVTRALRPRMRAGSEMIGQEWDNYLRHDGEPVDDLFEIPLGCAAPPRWEDGRPAPRPRLGLRGAKIREQVEQQLHDLAQQLGARDRDAEAIRAAFDRRAAAEARLASLPTAPLPPPPPLAPSPFAPVLAQAQAMVSAAGARLVVLVAPLDAQASPEARRRRGVSEAEAAMLDDVARTIVAEARAAGAGGVDATDALKALGAAAFLGDGHLAPAGHEAVARAVAAVLARASGPV